MHQNAHRYCNKSSNKNDATFFTKYHTLNNDIQAHIHIYCLCFSICTVTYINTTKERDIQGGMKRGWAIKQASKHTSGYR